MKTEAYFPQSNYSAGLTQNCQPKHSRLQDIKALIRISEHSLIYKAWEVFGSFAYVSSGAIRDHKLFSYNKSQLSIDRFPDNHFSPKLKS